jgi:hypothetical protein
MKSPGFGVEKMLAYVSVAAAVDQSIRGGV